MKQVDKSHYEFQQYMQKPRWSSVWYQLNEMAELRPQRVLEIGPGPGVFKTVAKLFGFHVETLDLDADLMPDHVGSATDIPLEDGSFDVVCAFQMLEHLPYEDALRALGEMVRISRRHVVISLPDCRRVWNYQLHVPMLGERFLSLPVPRMRAPVHRFDGEHYWELGKRGYPLERFVSDCRSLANLLRTYRVSDNPYHRFFVLERRG